MRQNKTDHASFSEAIFQIWEEHKNPKNIISDIEAVEEIYNDDKIHSFFSSYFYKFDEKLELLNENVKFKTTEVNNIVLVLIKDGSIKYIKKIIEGFYAKVDEHCNLLRCKVYSAIPISSKQLDRIKKVLEKKYNKEPVISLLIDKSIISGIKIIVNDDVYDGTFANELDRIKNNIELIER